MAAEKETINDISGRALLVRDLTALEEIRLLRAIGPAQSENRPYVELVQACAGVVSIDGKPMPRITSERTIDLVVEQLGDEGVQAVQTRRMMRLQKAYADLEKAMAAAQAAADAGEAVTDPSPLDKSASS